MFIRRPYRDNKREAIIVGGARLDYLVARHEL